jgi:hypothetical protein
MDRNQSHRQTNLSCSQIEKVHQASFYELATPDFLAGFLCLHFYRFSRLQQEPVGTPAELHVPG